MFRTLKFNAKFKLMMTMYLLPNSTRLPSTPGVLQKLKEGAENVQTKIQAKVESLKTVGDAGKGIYENISAV